MEKNVLVEIEAAFRQAVGEVKDLPALDQVRIAFLGRKGKLTALLRGVASLDPEERKTVGFEANRMKEAFQGEIDRLKGELVKNEREKELDESPDLTLPGRSLVRGRRHPISQVMEESLEIFRACGFSELQVPELETDFFNFEALNTPADHPARDLQDTFYLEGDYLLRTHTSTVQIHAMKTMKPPLRVMATGKCYRRDAIDATHFPIFHQIDGFLVDEEVTFGDLKGLMEHYACAIFGRETKIRFRPHFFPFTEPSAEVDFSCALCGGKGCGTCKGQGWVEIGGSGMTDPEVFKAMGYDAERYRGLAFGLGIERIAMMRHGIDDIRLFYENDLRFLEQF